MSLSAKQEEELYKVSIETNMTLKQILERLEKSDEILDRHCKKLRQLEVDHSLLKGKLGAFILGLTFIISLLVNGVLWAYSHLGGKA